VPAELSSAIPTVLTHLAHAEALQPAETSHLLAYLATIRDPRAGRVAAATRWLRSWL
jgi:hypothetical protein